MMWIAALALLASGAQDAPVPTPGTVTVEAVADDATPAAASWARVALSGLARRSSAARSSNAAA